MKRILRSALALFMILVITGCSGGIDSKLKEGNKLLDDEEYSDAISVFKEVLDKDDQNMEALKGIVEGYIEREKFEKANKYLEELCEAYLDKYEKKDKDELDDYSKSLAEDIVDFVKELKSEQLEMDKDVIEAMRFSGEMGLISSKDYVKAMGMKEEPTKDSSVAEEKEDKDTEQTTETKDTKTELTPESDYALKIGLILLNGVDDNFYGKLWYGLQQFSLDNDNILINYNVPSGFSDEEILSSIKPFCDEEYDIVIGAGWMFESAIHEAQNLYPDTEFILVDGMPRDMSTNEYYTAENTLSIMFSEEEAGFLAGVAAALSCENEKIGAIAGMEVPPVERYLNGFDAGIKYANSVYNTGVQYVDAIYTGSFSDIDSGQELAEFYYDDGVKTLYAVAGAGNIGVMEEAKDRRSYGEEVYVVGVDADNYFDGIMDNGESVILTSSIKNMENTIYGTLTGIFNYGFIGGEVLTVGVENNCVGLPEENPNLSYSTITKVEEVRKEIESGSIKVPVTDEELKNFMAMDESTTSVEIEDIEWVKLDSLGATSMFSETINGEYIEYDPVFMLDNDPATSWVEGVDGYGKGESVEFYYEEPITINKISLINGFAKSERLYYMNNRVKLIQVDYGDKMQSFELSDDELGYQSFDTGGIVTDYVMLTILQVYEGSDYDDTCIAEFEIN